MKRFSLCSVGMVLVGMLSGCMTGPTIYERNDEYSSAEPGSSQWWSEKAMLPPGVRQTCHKGKVWPVRPRPTGERQQFTHTYHSTHYWPLPYVCQDRQYVKDIMETQTSLGWQEETTLYNRHFDPQSQTLTTPGQLHMQQIVEVTPIQRRTIYVQSTRNPEVDEIRVRNVESAIAEFTHGQEAIPVLVRQTREYSRPAREVKIINDLYEASTPTPRLASGASSGASAAAAAGGAGGAASGP